MNDHNWTLEYLAWYVNGTLVGDEYARAHRHVKQCLVCQQEQLALNHIADTVNAAKNTHTDAAGALSEVHARISQTGVTRSSWLQSCTALLTATPSAVRVAVLAQSLLLIGALFLWNSQLQPPTATQYRTLSNSAVIEGDVRILFKPNTSVTEQTQILKGINAQIVQGPSERGIYTLSLPLDANPQIVQTLGQNPHVELALPLGRLLKANQ